MPEAQKYIYYATGDSLKTASGLPQNEQIKSKGFEILYFTDDVDEFVAQILGSYEEKEFRSVTSSDLGLESEEDKKELEAETEKSKPLIDYLKDCLKDEVSDVKLSSALVTSPVCMSYEGDISLEMERYFSAIPGEAGQQVKAKRVLELNPSHHIFSALEAAFESDKEKAGKIAQVLCTQAKLLAGLPVDDLAGYTELVCQLI